MWGESDNGARGRKTAPADFAPRAPLANLWPDNKNLWLSPDISRVCALACTCCAGINFYSTCPTSLRPRNNRPRCQITRSRFLHISLCEHNRSAAGLASGAATSTSSAIWGMGISRFHEAHFPRLFSLVGFLPIQSKMGFLPVTLSV